MLHSILHYSVYLQILSASGVILIWGRSEVLRAGLCEVPGDSCCQETPPQGTEGPVGRPRVRRVERPRATLGTHLQAAGEVWPPEAGVVCLLVVMLTA